MAQDDQGLVQDGTVGMGGTDPFAFQGVPVSVINSYKTNKRRVRKISPYQVEESEFWIIEMSGPIVNSMELEATQGLPVWGSPMRSNPRLFVINYHAEMMQDAPQCYELEVVYSNFYPRDLFKLQSKEFLPEENPLQRPALIESSTYRTRKVWDVDLNGKPFTTTAGEPIIHEEEISRRVFSVTKNVQAISNIFLVDGDFMNEDTVTIFGQKFKPETLWLTDINLSAQQIDYHVPYFVLSYKLYHNADVDDQGRPLGWRVRKRNAGYYCLEQVNTISKPLLKPTTVPPSLFGTVDPTNYPANLVYSPIKVGSPEQFTRTPLPLRNTPNDPTTHGKLFDQYRTIDPLTKQRIDPEKVALAPADLKKIWKEATLVFQTKQLIKFKGNIPLT